MLAQSMRNFDIFIQEDGPVSREMEDYLTGLLHSQDVAHLGRRDINVGLAASLNELLRIVLARDYKYLARMDADDICDLSRIEQQFQFMEKNPHVDIVGSWMLEFNETTGEQQIVRYPETHEEIFRFMVKRCPMAHVTTFFRRSFFEKAGLYPTDTVLNEDGALWFEGFRKGCIFHNIQLPLVKVRINDSFFDRRAGVRKAWEDFKLKAAIAREFSFGLRGYFYAFAYAVLLVLPPSVKKFCYRNLRE